jgi:hypothetical protein
MRLSWRDRTFRISLKFKRRPFITTLAGCIVMLLGIKGAHAQPHSRVSKRTPETGPMLPAYRALVSPACPPAVEFLRCPSSACSYHVEITNEHDTYLPSLRIWRVQFFRLRNATLHTSHPRFFAIGQHVCMCELGSRSLRWSRRLN